MEGIEEAVRELVRDEVARCLKRATVKVTPQGVPEDPRQLYSVAAVAARLEMSTDWVYDRIKAGELAVVELGSTRGKQRISVTELQRFIDARTFGTPRTVL